MPQSVMPGYPALAETEVDLDDIPAHLRASRAVGVPYTDEQIANARADLKAQVDPDGAGSRCVSETLSEGDRTQF